MSFLKYDSCAIVTKDYGIDSKSRKIVEFLKKNDHKVVGIDYDKFINTQSIKIYESLKDVPHNIDIVIIVEETIEIYTILEEMELLDINNIWFEQDSYSELIIKKAKSLNINVIYGVSLCRELSR